ncbi:MAG: lamin tail domain-containing protein [Crocinitomicaceae bacterium]|nr:lamin tail domain-containing protein [Crocinitomicaceae bacterium]
MKWIPQIILFFLWMTTVNVHSQVMDDFSDGDFSNNPSWNGNTAEFAVNASQQLQLNNTISGSSYLSLTHGINTLQNHEWHFWVKQSFSPSSSNYGKVFLSADNSDLTAVQNGYFVLFGEANAVDAIRLFKLVNGIPTQLCSGVDGQISNSFTVGIKVVLNPSGNWELSADLSGGTNYVLQGSANDPNILSGSYFGYLCTYTSSNANKFYLDDVYIGNPILDLQAPILLQASVITPNQVDVLFNEALSPTSANEVANYAILPFNSFVTAQQDNVNQALVHLTTMFPLTNGNSYSIMTANLSDLVGNTSGNQAASFDYLVADTAEKGDVIITEFFADPTPVIGLPEVEYVEIFNKTGKVFHLQNWTISDGSSNGTIGDFWLLPGSYIVLTANANFGLFTNVAGVTSFPSLNNAGDQLILTDQTGLLLDRLTYTDEWYQDPTKQEGGYSLERINLNDPCSNYDNWSASNDPSGGSPGTINSIFSAAPDNQNPNLLSLIALSPNFLEVSFSEGMDSISLANTQISASPNLSVQETFIQVVNDNPNGPPQFIIQFNENFLPSTTYQIQLGPVSDCWQNDTTFIGQFTLPEQAQAGDIVINEILANPLNGGQDFIELYNRSTKVIDLKDWQIANYDNDTISNLKTISNHFILEPNSYVAISEDTSFLLENYPASISGRMIQMDMPSYNIDSGTIYLFYNSEQIDRVSYSEDWQLSLIDNSDGVSLERISPNASSNQTSNWHSAAESIGFATPGRVNSQYQYVGTSESISLQKDVFSPDQDGFEDILVVNYAFSESGLLAKARIFDDFGREVKVLFSNELMGTTGFFTWDGVNTKQAKAPIGIYVLVIEVFSVDGAVILAKKIPFTLAGKL